MHNVTQEMLIFKEAIRHCWNAYFSRCAAPMSPEVQESFEEVERGLFGGIVLAPLGLSSRASEYRKTPLSWLIISPSAEAQEIPMQFGEVDSLGNTSWRMPTVQPVDASTSFEFFDFFDWYPYGVVDLPYVRARVADLPSAPDTRGKMALIEQRFCQFQIVCGN